MFSLFSESQGLLYGQSLLKIFAHKTIFLLPIIFPLQHILCTASSYFLKIKFGSCCFFPQESSVAPYGVKSRPCVDLSKCLHALTVILGSVFFPAWAFDSSLPGLFPPSSFFAWKSLLYLCHMVFPSPSGYNPWLLPLGPRRCCGHLDDTCALFCACAMIICVSLCTEKQGLFNLSLCLNDIWHL